jgi:hypothetical protein
MYWGVWRERRVVDALGAVTVKQEWVRDRGGILAFKTQAEAQRTAGVWNVLRDGWRYQARRIA